MPLLYRAILLFLVVGILSGPTSGVLAETVVLTPSKDNTIFELKADDTTALSNGAGSTLIAGMTDDDLDPRIRRALMHFDIAGNIPAGAQIVSAELKLTLVRVSRDINSPLSVTANLHRLLADFGEGTSNADTDPASSSIGGGPGVGALATPADATWRHATFPSAFWNSLGGDFATGASASQTIQRTLGDYTWSAATMVSDVQAWLDSPVANFGWILIVEEALRASTRGFGSRDNPVPGLRPTLTIEFVTTAPSTLSAAVLPTSRASQVGQSATALATMINSGSDTATGCRIDPPAGLAATLTFQTTDPANNALTGSPNMPVDISAGGVQTFALIVTPAQDIDPIELDFSFTCANRTPAASVSGVNTLTFSASSTPIADVVALASTTGAPGVVDVPANGTGVFAVATINLGASSSITATVGTRPADLPVTLGICQTDPATGACATNVATSVPTNVPANDTPTFAIFISGTGQTIAFAPGTNRIAVDFVDASGAIRGGTSVAVRTP